MARQPCCSDICPLRRSIIPIAYSTSRVFSFPIVSRPCTLKKTTVSRANCPTPSPSTLPPVTSAPKVSPSTARPHCDSTQGPSTGLGRLAHLRPSHQHMSSTLHPSTYVREPDRRGQTVHALWTVSDRTEATTDAMPLPSPRPTQCHGKAAQSFGAVLWRHRRRSHCTRISTTATRFAVRPPPSRPPLILQLDAPPGTQKNPSPWCRVAPVRVSCLNSLAPLPPGIQTISEQY